MNGKKENLKREVKEQIGEPKKIAHIGIAVNNINHILPFYTNILGLTLESIDSIQSEAVKVAFLKIGQSRFELLEPLNDSSPIKRFLDKHGEGIHHIALEVDNICERLNQYKIDGVQLINDKPKDGAHDSKIAFIHPKSANGVLFELCQNKRGSEG